MQSTNSSFPVRMPRHPSTFAAMVWGHLVNDGLSQYLPGILPLIAVQRHIPLFLLGSLMTAMLLGQMLQPFAGILSDAIGGRALALLGPVLAALSTIGVSFAHSYALIALSLFLAGLGSTIYHPQALTIARRMAGPGQGFAMSLFLVGGELGRALAPLAAGIVAASLGLAHIWLLGLLLVLTWPWLLRVVPSLPKRAPDRAPLTLRGHLGPALSLLSFTAFRAAAISSVVTLLPLIWQKDGGSLIAGASLVTTMIGIGIAGNLSGGLLRDRFGAQVVLWSSASVSAAALIVLVFSRGLWLWPILGVLGIAMFSTASVTMLIGQDIFHENPALGSGIALGLGNGIGALLILPISYIAQHVGLATALEVTVLLPLLSMAGIRSLGATGRRVQARGTSASA